MSGFSRKWWLGVGVTTTAMVVVWALPVGSMERSVVARLIGVVACIVYWVAALRLPPRSRDVWLLFGGAMALTVIGDLMYDATRLTTANVTSPHPTDIPYMLTYVLMFAGLTLILHRLLPGRTLETWIDTAIASIAISAVAATFIIGPILLNAGSFNIGLIMALFYPLADLVVLAVLLRILLGLRRGNSALLLLALATALFLVSDLWYQMLAASGDLGEPRMLEVLWVGGLMVYSLAVTAPGADSERPRPRGAPVEFNALAIVVLIIGVLTTPILLVLAVFAGEEWITGWLAAANLIIVILLLWRASLLILKVQRQASELVGQARLDSLTGLPNRRAWDHDLAHAVSVAVRTGSPLTIAMLDLDHFKEFNDTYGHQAGDALLSEAAQLWKRQLTRGDVLARYGGEEFGLLLPGLDVRAAASLLDRLRIITPGKTTVSIGATDLVAGEPVEVALLRADQALYRAKSAGRDQVVATPMNEATRQAGD